LKLEIYIAASVVLHVMAICDPALIPGSSTAVSLAAALPMQIRKLKSFNTQSAELCKFKHVRLSRAR
jgi:hypothetical protein